MMDCRTVADLLLKFRDGELSEADTETLRQHLHLCPPCLDLMNTYEEVVAVLERLRPVSMPEGCLERLHARVKEERGAE